MKTLIKEQIYAVKGTTKFLIGDPSYFEELEAGSKNKNLKNLVFSGNISAAPNGIMRVCLWKKVDDKDGFEWEDITVDIYQGSNYGMVKTYYNGQYWPVAVKKEVDLGCDSASFEIETKQGYDLFHTGADGWFGQLTVMKQYYGMILHLSFDPDMFDYDEIVARFLRLFPEAKKDRPAIQEMIK